MSNSQHDINGIYFPLVESFELWQRARLYNYIIFNLELDEEFGVARDDWKGRISVFDYGVYSKG